LEAQSWLVRVTVNKNGISLLNGTNFRVISVTSSTQGAINLATGPGTIAGGKTEVWNVVVQFAPVAFGVLNDGLQVASNDPKEPNFVASVQGMGLSPMQLQVLNSTGTSSIVAVAFPGVDADGPDKQQAATNILLRNYPIRCLPPMIWQFRLEPCSTTQPPPKQSR